MPRACPYLYGIVDPHKEPVASNEVRYSGSVQRLEHNTVGIHHNQLNAA